MAKFILTIESDDPKEIAHFLSPPPALTQDTRIVVPTGNYVSQNAEPLPVEAVVEMQAEKPKGRKVKAEPAASVAGPTLSTTSQTDLEKPDASSSAATINDLSEAIRKAVNAKSAQAAVQALKERFGTPSPAQIPAECYAEAIALLESL